MKFTTKKIQQPINKELRYIADDYSFDMSPSAPGVNFTILINTLNLTVNNDNSVIEIWGFCPRGRWIKGNFQVPYYYPGTLIVLDDLEPGFSYSINKNETIFNESPIYEDVKTGWVCAGDPQGKGQAVEFIKNCVAVVDDTGMLKALWLKPKYE